jgi:hypothetical protein
MYTAPVAIKKKKSHLLPGLIDQYKKIFKDKEAQ